MVLSSVVKKKYINLIELVKSSAIKKCNLMLVPIKSIVMLLVTCFNRSVTLVNVCYL